MLMAVTVYVARDGVYHGDTVATCGHDFVGTDGAFCDAVDAAKARGADPTRVRLVAMLATSE